MLLKETALFTLPLFIAGLVHHFFIIKYNFFEFLAKPIDFHLKLGNRRFFGDSKTFRGFITVILFTGFSMVAINAFLGIPLKLNSFLSGMLLGLGYSLGELPNSFLKRRLNIRESSLPHGAFGLLLHILDQTDSVIGSLILLPVIYSPSSILIIILFSLGTTLHILVDLLLYLYGYKEVS
jgi:Na+-transporting NADH:ubiquinone oxidoreductase subunit NqrD